MAGVRSCRAVKILREADRNFILLDGTLAECDRSGDSRADWA